MPKAPVPKTVLVHPRYRIRIWGGRWGEIRAYFQQAHTVRGLLMHHQDWEAAGAGGLFFSGWFQVS